MFNESLKCLFMKEVISGKDVESMFNKSQPYEEKYGKDLCAFTQDELQEYANNELGIMGSTRQTRFSILRKYIDWCDEKKIPGVCNVVGDIDQKDYTRIRDSMVSSPAHLGKVLDTVFRDPDQHTIDNAYRTFLWLAFSGVLVSDVTNVKAGDVDFSRMEIRFSQQRVPIYRESVIAMKDCVDLSQFRKEISNGRGTSEYVWIDRADGSVLIRGFSDGVIVNTMYTMVRRAINAAKKSNAARDFRIPMLSYVHTYMSGQFFRLREREMMGIPVDFRDILTQECLIDGTYNPSDPKFLSNLRVKIYRRKMDYECWKAAFSK